MVRPSEHSPAMLFNYVGKVFLLRLGQICPPPARYLLLYLVPLPTKRTGSKNARSSEALLPQKSGGFAWQRLSFYFFVLKHNLKN